MAAVDVTISGVLFDKHNRTTQQVVLIGEATLTGLGVGGGPMPPGQGGGGGSPPSIWPDPGRPAHPIAPGGPPPGIWPSPGYPAHPIAPGGPPPSVWPDPGRPHPEHPITLPEPPAEPIQPPIEWKAVWHPTEGWIVVGIPNLPHPAPGE